MIANLRGVNTPTVANTEHRCDISGLAKLLKMEPLNLERRNSRILASQSLPGRERNQERVLWWDAGEETTLLQRAAGKSSHRDLQVAAEIGAQDPRTAYCRFCAVPGLTPQRQELGGDRWRE